MTNRALGEHSSAAIGDGDLDLYQAVFGNAPNCLAVHEVTVEPSSAAADYVYLAVNGAFEEKLGLSAADVVGKRLSQVLSVELFEVQRQAFDEVLATREARQFDLRQPRTNRHFAVSAFLAGPGRVATISVDVTDRQVAGQALAERERYLEALVEVQQALLALGSNDERRRSVLEVLGPVSGASRVSIYENQRDDSGCLTARRCAEWQATRIPRAAQQPVLETLRYQDVCPRWEELLARGDVVAGTVASLPDAERWLLEAQGARSALLLPLTVSGEFHGFFGFTNCAEAREWDASEVALLKAAAAAFSLAQERSQAEDRLRYVSFHDSLTGVYNRACFEVEVSLLKGGREYPISIISTDIDGLKLINDTMGHRNGDDLLKAFGELLRDTFRPSDIVARIGGDEFAIILPRTDSEEAEVLSRRLEQRVATFNLTLEQIPLSISFGLETADDKEVSLDDVFKRADQAMYQDKLRRSASASHGIVKALLATLKAKDSISEGHTRRVCDVAVRLGEASDLSKRERSHLELLAEVHDLGKVGIPDHVLFKNGPLTPDEREQMKQHSTIGYRVAKSSPELAHIADLILHHHEWWNGDGYPLGLKGEAIPLESRILAIADAYDAMTNDRPYRKALSHDEAIRELGRWAGVQFDPELVRRFVECTGDVQASGEAAMAKA